MQTSGDISMQQIEAAVQLREALHAAQSEPVVLTIDGEPAYVVHSVAEDDIMEDLIAANPDFLASIQKAREQKHRGKVKTLADLRARYASGDEQKTTGQ